MRPFHVIALLGPFLFACGLGASELPGTPPGPNPDDGGDYDASGCGLAPPVDCALPCGGGFTARECVNNSWQCPIYEGTACPIDAGCAGPLPTCPLYCNGQSATAYCGSGVWECTYDSLCIEDAGPDVFDAGPDVTAVDANPPDPLFACGDIACDPQTSYCEIVAGGPVSEDGGTATSYSCNSLPGVCQGGGATCGCIAGLQGGGCGCVASGGKVIETCEAP